MKKKTQKDVILEHLRKHQTITSWDAIMEYGITRLASVIHMLRDDGIKITSKPINKKTRLGNITTIAEYRLINKRIDLFSLWN